MNFNQISTLSRVLPPASAVAKRLNAEARTGAFDPNQSLTGLTVKHPFIGQIFVPAEDVPFLHGYQQVKYGWEAATRLALFKIDFPIITEGPDNWVFKAWALLRFGASVVDRRDIETIQGAWALHHDENHAASANAVRALLLSEESTVDSVAEDTNLDRDLVEAYEVLFFNVIGRRHDLLFLRNLVYPHSRFDEMSEDFAKVTSYRDRMLRASYSADRSTTLFLCGFRPAGFMEEAVDTASNKFQQLLMQTGAVMAAGGMLWMRKGHTTVSAARSFMQTSKLAGENLGKEDGFQTLGEVFRGELERASADQVRAANEKAALS